MRWLRKSGKVSFSLDGEITISAAAALLCFLTALIASLFVDTASAPQLIAIWLPFACAVAWNILDEERVR